MATEILAGTSGYSYKGWKGVFYPEDLPQDQWLNYYGQQLPSVEINNTFYRMPREHVVQAWHDAVPQHFQFVIKASRRITHQSRLKDTDEATGYLLKRAAVLGDKLGAVLFQLPPYMRADRQRLHDFAQLLPAGFPAAFEFRHESWQDSAIDDILQQYGHTRVVSHDDNSNNRSKIVLPDSGFIYVRLRASSYSPNLLKKWHTALTNRGAEKAFVFFKHEDDGEGAKLAQKFLAQPVAAPVSAKPARRAPRRPAASRRPATKKTSR